jgi:heterodisulfide reductase subunit C
VLSEFAINNGAHQKTVDLQRMYDQMVYKDGRIVELNNIILEKERNIMDLQEM